MDFDQAEQIAHQYGTNQEYTSLLKAFLESIEHNPSDWFEKDPGTTMDQRPVGLTIITHASGIEVVLRKGSGKSLARAARRTTDVKIKTCNMQIFLSPLKPLYGPYVPHRFRMGKICMDVSSWTAVSVIQKISHDLCASGREKRSAFEDLLRVDMFPFFPGKKVLSIDNGTIRVRNGEHVCSKAKDTADRRWKNTPINFALNTRTLKMVPYIFAEIDVPTRAHDVYHLIEQHGSYRT